MLQPRIYSQEASLTTLATTLNRLSLCARHAPKPSRPQLIFVRHASHAQQGRANGPKDSAGRRLGAKKTASQYVIPGNIIFKQRGTKWFPGENVGIGKDHTIYSQVYGYVRYYRNPAVHPKRRYIGVALEREGPGSQLPTPHNAPTRRRLGMHAAPISVPKPSSIPTPTPTPASTSVSSEPTPSAFLDANIAKDAVFLPQTMTEVKPFDPANTTRRGGHGVSNWQIGRAAEIKGIKVREFDRKDRWKAWRVRVKKIEMKRTSRAAKGTKKTKGKKSNKKVVL